MTQRSLATAFALLVVSACTPEDIVFVEDAEPAVDENAPVCRSTAECDASQRCAKVACGAAEGRCVARPVFCTGEAKPVCGCDGVTYWNECVAASRGVEATAEGECGSRAAPCGGPGHLACPGSAYCARLLPPGPDGCPPRGADVPGTCWALPATCADDPRGGDAFRACGAPPDECVEACSAIRSELPHQRADRCAPPPPR